MKTEYTSVELEIIIFETDDVITSSCPSETEQIHV